MQGICIDTGEAAALEQDKKYFLFPNGSTHYYVSKFPRQSAHFGCFQAKLFQVVEEEKWPAEPKEVEIDLDREKLYTAELVWRREAYQTEIGTRYYLKPGRNLVDVYSDKERAKYHGFYPVHWFKDYQEIGQILDKTVTEPEESDHIKVENVQILDETGQFEQLSLF